MKTAYRLLIGSLGDDIHSVGMALLTLAFRESGFYVKNMGIGNTLDDFFNHAADFDAMFISCNNGHVDMYLEEFPHKLKHFTLGNSDPKVWYLGGNLSVKEKDDTVVRQFRSLGFDFVAPKPVSWMTILENLKRDFHNKQIHPRDLLSHGEHEIPPMPDLDTVTDEPMSQQEFELTRRDVLASWPTGASVWLTDVKKNHSVPAKNLHHLIKTQQTSPYRPLLQPRTGVAHIQDEIEILKLLRENGMDVSSIQLDAASRKNMYAKAEEGVRRSEKGGTSFLNGYPVPVHGVAGIEEILNAIETPFQIRAGSPDHRLVYEIGIAGGTSSVEGGFLCYLYPYDKRTSPVANLKNWKYVDKLTGIYQQQGITVNREYFGPLTTSLIEPSLAIAINVVQAILTAKAGGVCVSLGLAEQGNRIQDIAAIRALDKVGRAWLTKYGFPKVTVSTVFHQYMAAFPNNLEKARELIVASSTTGALARSTKFMIKTPVESIHIPTRHDNAEALRLTKAGVAKAGDAKPEWTLVETEMAMIEREANIILGEIEKLGNGSMARGAIKAFQNGLLDVPFSPSLYNRNEIITARDCDGAVRFVNPELLPFDDQIIEYHKEKIHRRMVMERRTKSSELIEQDLTRIWKGDYVRWPLDGLYVH